MEVRQVASFYFRLIQTKGVAPTLHFPIIFCFFALHLQFFRAGYRSFELEEHTTALKRKIVQHTTKQLLRKSSYKNNLIMCHYCETIHRGCRHSTLSKKQSCKRSKPCHREAYSFEEGNPFCQTCLISFGIQTVIQTRSSSKGKESPAVSGVSGWMVGPAALRDPRSGQGKHGEVSEWTWDSIGETTAVRKSPPYHFLPGMSGQQSIITERLAGDPGGSSAAQCRDNELRQWEIIDRDSDDEHL